MKSHRTIILIGGVLVALAPALPSPALASSLLSGYGGPGQGNQAILGSALVNGGRGGGSSGGTSSTSPGGSAASSPVNGGSTSPSSGASGTLRRGNAGAAKAPNGRRAGGGRAAHKSGEEGTPADARGAASFYPASERVLAGSGVLGLSGADLIYVILAVGALIFMGVVTVRLTGKTRRRGIGN
jgi:hypothetical protein